MSTAEQLPGSNRDIEGNSIIETLASFISHEIKIEDLTDHDRWIVGFYGTGGRMYEDKVFKEKVLRRVQEKEIEKNSRLKEDAIRMSNKIEIAALRRLGRVKLEDMGEENREELRMLEEEAKCNPELEEWIVTRQNQICLERVIKTSKRKVAVKRKRQATERERYVQPSFWPSAVQTEGLVFESDIDPDSRISKVGKSLDGRFKNYMDKVLEEEMRKKRLELRNKVGLPIARNGSVYHDNRFYKFLVRRVVTWDLFHIFGDYCCERFDVPEELNVRIGEVKELIDKLISKNQLLSQHKKYKLVDEFVDEYGQKWNINMDRYYYVKSLKL